MATQGQVRITLSIVCILFCGAALHACGGKGSGGAVIRVQSKPVDGAQVRVGATTYGTTPCEITGMPPGQLYLILNAEGYHRTTYELEVPESGILDVVVDLEPLVGYLTIESTPTDASVFLDSTEYIGKTPMVAHPLPIGDHTYVIRLENYLETSKEIKIEVDKRYTFVHALTPMVAQLNVLSQPSGATIWINEEKQEKKSPARFTLNSGTYYLAAHMDGYIMKEQNVELEPNSTSEVVIRMEKGYVPPGMILVPAGEFRMGTNGGAPDEMPRRAVNLAAFYIDKFEVTNQDYAAVFPSHQFETAFGQFPVGGVSWVQAKAYADALGKRLPTEAEWEKAARGVEAREYPWGNTFNPEYCNVPGQLEARIQRIGTYRQWGSPYGCMDMAGNVYEWVEDWYDAYPGNTAVKTQYGQVYRVLRGGSYKVSNAEFDVRCAARHYDIRDAKREDYGFRCALDAKP